MHPQQQHLDTIQRELVKRSITYPKIVARKQKQWAAEELDVLSLTIDLTTTQRIRYELLDSLYCMIEIWDDLSQNEKLAIFRELQYERRLRKQYYPRWVRWQRMTEETALAGIAEWEALTNWFWQTHCPDEPWRKPAQRKPHG